MIESSPQAWSGFALLVGLAVVAGSKLSGCIPWSVAARRAGLDWATGLVLAPFLLGMASVLALGVIPGASHHMHLMLGVGLMVLTTSVAWRFRAPATARVPCSSQLARGEQCLAAFVVAWITALLVNAVFLPLVANDALEYATVGRLLFETRDLASYPAIHPESTGSGFYGPWSHPPLYPALIYLTQVVQGHASEPGLMRMISPWFAIATTALVFAMGNMAGRTAGWAAALVFISAQLFFSGADSASIDALPVAGFCLVTSLLMGIAGSAWQRGVWIGMGMGLALWTHSQSILVVPLGLAVLALFHGRSNWRSVLVETVFILGVAALVSAWPYFRNYTIYGALISDNPAVFAMPELRWKDYFLMSAGLNHGLSVLQYGVLKGWFSVYSFGASYWLMTLGAVLLSVRSSGAGARRTLEHGLRAHPQGVVWACLGLVGIYTLGVVTSLMLGLDLMVKNDRYLLVMLPMVAVVAGYGAQRVLGAGRRIWGNSRAGSWLRFWLTAGALAAVGLLSAQLVVVGWYSKWSYVLDARSSGHGHQVLQAYGAQTRFDRILDNTPHIEVVRWLSRELPKEAVILALRPSDMYYARQRMISYLDPRMLPIYREKDPPRAATMLRAMGITHIQLTDYELPVSYNSVLSSVVNDPALAKLVHGTSGAQVYELTDSGRHPIAPLIFTPGDMEWTSWTLLTIPRAEYLAHLGGPFGQPVRDNAEMSITARVPFAHRAFETTLASGLGGPFARVAVDSLLPVVAGREYRVRLDLSGEAFVQLYMMQFDGNGRQVHATRIAGADRIGELVLRGESGPKHFARRFVSLPGVRFVRFGVERMGYSRIKVEHAELSELKATESGASGRLN